MSKTPDLRDGDDKVAPTDNHAIRAGTADRPDNVRMPKSDMHATSPDPGAHLAEGQVTKSN